MSRRFTGADVRKAAETTVDEFVGATMRGVDAGDARRFAVQSGCATVGAIDTKTAFWVRCSCNSEARYYNRETDCPRCGRPLPRVKGWNR